MATNMLKNTKKTYSQSVTVKKRSNFTPDNLFLKTLIEGDFTMSSFRQFQTSITLLVKKYFLMSLLQIGVICLSAQSKTNKKNVPMYIVNFR